MLALEFAVLIRLRLRELQKARAFRIAGGWPAIAVITLAPLLCFGCRLWASIIGARDAGTYEGSAAAVFDDDAAAQNFQLAMVTSVVGTGIAVYFLKRKHLSRAP